MAEPKRIQLRRTKGWRKPEGAVVVARPSRWGNPYQVGQALRLGYGDTVTVLDAERAVALFRRWLVEPHPTVDQVRARDLEPLRGRDLCCWCPLDQPCHADVLLELANGPTDG